MPDTQHARSQFHHTLRKHRALRRTVGGCWINTLARGWSQTPQMSTNRFPFNGFRTNLTTRVQR